MTRKEIEMACDRAWDEKFLELTGHKIGDEVECVFFPKGGNTKQCYMTSKEGKGKIVETENGVFVKSCNKYTKADSRRNARHQIYWVYEEDYLLSDVRYIRIKEDKQ